MADEELGVVVGGIDEPAGDVVGRVAPDDAGRRVVDVEAVDLDQELAVPAGRQADIDVGLAEDGEQVAAAGLLEQLVGHREVGIHAGGQDGQIAEAHRLAGLLVGPGVEGEAAHDEDVEVTAGLERSNLPPIRLPDRTTELRLLLEAREDLVAESNRARNRLHAHLLTLAPGYGGTVTNLVASRHRATVGRLLRGISGVQAELARGLLLRLARLEREVKVLTRRIGALVAGHPLLGLPGAGPITAARLIAEVGDVHRFRSADALAALAGVAPIPASSGQVQRMRLNRGGNRQLNRAFYFIAVIQSRFHPPAKAYMTRRIEVDGKSWREAIRALKRMLVRAVFRLLVEGAAAQVEAA